MYDSLSNNLKITDFGIAKLIDANRTRTGIVLGTPAFMSPEQLEGKNVNGHTDLFALGVSLYQLLTGQLPFRGASMTNLMFVIANEPHQSVTSVRADLPKWLDEIVDRALAKNPADRFQIGRRHGGRPAACGLRREGRTGAAARMSLKGKLVHVEVTDVGKVRDHNEDAIGSQPEIGLWVLADGMGGYNAGEVASGIAVKTIIDLVTQACKTEKRGDIESGTGYMRQTIVLRDAIHRANKVINQTAQSQPQCEGMGTTLVASLFYDNRVSIAHVGDSRMYRLRGNRFEQITMDHSLLQELVDRGFYSQEEAQRSTNRNYVTRALGVEANVEVEVQEVEVQKGDYFLDVLGRSARHGRGRGHPSHDQHVQQRRSHGRRAAHQADERQRRPRQRLGRSGASRRFLPGGRRYA